MNSRVERLKLWQRVKEDDISLYNIYETLELNLLLLENRKEEE